MLLVCTRLHSFAARLQILDWYTATYGIFGVCKRVFAISLNLTLQLLLHSLEYQRGFFIHGNSIKSYFEEASCSLVISLKTAAHTDAYLRHALYFLILPPQRLAFGALYGVTYRSAPLGAVSAPQSKGNQQLLAVSYGPKDIKNRRWYMSWCISDRLR
jgi:hypothetical protein